MERKRDAAVVSALFSSEMTSELSDHPNHLISTLYATAALPIRNSASPTMHRQMSVDERSVAQRASSHRLQHFSEARAEFEANLLLKVASTDNVTAESLD